MERVSTDRGKEEPQCQPVDSQNSSRKEEAVSDGGDTTSDASQAQQYSPHSGLKTSDFYKLHEKVPNRFNKPDCFKGYGKVESHPCYQRTSDDYGGLPPSVHTMPTKFFGRSQKFTGYYMRFGMYRNHSFNTAEDKSVV